MNKFKFSEMCFSCRECCRFLKSQQYFAPVFTEEEYKKLKSMHKNLPRFKRHIGSKNVYQVILKKSKLYPKEYVCPFLDEKKHSYKIYNNRPFDCKIWPFIVMKKGKRTVISYFSGDYCDIVDSLPRKIFNSYKKSVVEFITSKKCLRTIKTHPALIWKYEKGTKRVKDITKLLNSSIC